MMRKAKISFRKSIRFSIATFLFIILFLIGWNFITQLRKKPKVPVEKEEITPQKVEMKEKIEHFEVKGERGDFKVRADKHYVGEDNKYHLEGNVEVVFFKKSEGRDIFIYGEEIIYDEEWNHFLLSGKAGLRFKDTLIESPSLDYDSKREVFESTKGVRFSSLALSGSARVMFYSIKREKLKLREDIYLKIKPHLETPFPVEIKGERLDYSRKGKRGTVEGDVRLSHGKSRVWADSAKFELFANEEQIKSIIFKGRVRISIIEKEQVISQKRTSLIPHGTEREIKADEIKLRGFLDLPQIHSLEARGGCSFKFISSDEGFTLIQGESIKIVLSRKGELREFHSMKKALIIEQGEEPKPTRLIEGEVMTMAGEAEVLNIRGEKNLKPRILFKGGEIYADEILIFLNSNNLELKGDVRAALQLGRGEEKSVGFFSREEPVFITAQKMRYYEEQKRFLFKERIKMWQEKKTLRAEEVILDEETGKIFCLGGVKSIVPYRPKNREEERIEISAHAMSFKPEENLIFFREKGSLKIKNINLQAHSIFVHLKGKKGDMERILAQGKVIIVQDLREGHGEEARYDLDKETIVLLGNPVLIEKDRGIVKGDKLTFYMADGRIVVENKDRERSVTVIKS